MTSGTPPWCQMTHIFSPCINNVDLNSYWLHFEIELDSYEKHIFAIVNNLHVPVAPDATLGFCIQQIDPHPVLYYEDTSNKAALTYNPTWQQ